MANKKQVGGFFVYHDDRGRSIYYDVFTKNGYLINNRDQDKFALFNLRYLLAALAFMIVFVFFGAESLFWALLSALITFIITYLVFRFTFMNKLPLLPGFVKPKKLSFIAQTAQDLSSGTLLVVIFMCLALTGLFIINIGLSEISGTELWGYYVVIAILIIFACAHIASLVIKLTNKKN